MGFDLVQDFYKACENGDVGQLNELYSCDRKGQIDDEACPYDCFELVCEHGHLEAAKWLADIFDLSLDSLLNGFRTACLFGRENIVVWMMEEFDMDGDSLLCSDKRRSTCYGCAAFRRGQDKILRLIFGMDESE